jgi:hypothetical protein
MPVRRGFSGYWRRLSLVCSVIAGIRILIIGHAPSMYEPAKLLQISDFNPSIIFKNSA